MADKTVVIGPQSGNNNSSTFNANKNKKRQRSNPLAAARGNAKRAEQLWHRKTGAGFSLFCEYYAQQPGGVVCDVSGASKVSSDLSENVREGAKDDGKTIVVSASAGANDAGGAGLSRAAKRRKKKKGQNMAQVSATLEEAVKGPKPVTPQPQAPAPAPVCKTDPRLCKALDASSSLNNAQKQALRPVMTALSQPLPLTFRIRHGLDPKRTDSLAATITKEFGDVVKALPYDSNSSSTNATSMIYQAKSGNLSKTNLTKTAPALKAFLVEHAADGSLARQELGSMLPVLALTAGGYITDNSSSDSTNTNDNTEKPCRVLDLCASPGSKTLQALEMVASTTGSGGTRVKANDINAKRLETLKQAVGRSGMPVGMLDGIKYTLSDATQFPIPITEKRLYDAVLCDVPCSGDGTVRKDLHILPAWTPSTGAALHSLQLNILKRALACLRPGGVVSYSTCSLNPIEDEAVVAAALTQVCAQARKQRNRNNKLQGSAVEKVSRRKADDDAVGPAVELVPWPGLPGLTHRPGVSEWKIADYVVGNKAPVVIPGVNDVDDKKNGNDDEEDSGDEDDDDQNEDETVRLSWYSSYDDAKAANMEHAVSSMWPPTQSDNVDLHLERCARLWPQDHDTGGFFVALLRKNW
jgi:tRNA (cytosine34-C5)-methyltransferase